MTDEANALVEALKRDTLTYDQRWKLVGLVETQAREIERLREELMQIEVDAMEYYNDWMEHGCEQVEATRFAFDLGQYARAALAGDSHDQ